VITRSWRSPTLRGLVRMEVIGGLALLQV
jgi:hypothetical protein